MPIVIPEEYHSPLKTLGLDKFDAPDAKELSKLERHSFEWHQHCAITLGAAEVARAAGVSKQGTGDQLLRQKFGANIANPLLLRREKEAAAKYLKQDAWDPAVLPVWVHGLF